jgi:hypothetical protein
VQNGLVAQRGADESRHRHTDALAKDIEILRANVNPPRPDPNSVVDTILQMGLAIGRITQPLSEGPTRTPEQEAKAQHATFPSGFVLLVLLTVGPVAGLLWHLFLGGEVGIELIAGLGISLVGGMMLGILGLVASALVKVMLSVMRERRARHHSTSGPD